MAATSRWWCARISAISSGADPIGADFAIRPGIYDRAAYAPLLDEARAAGLPFMDRMRDEWLSGMLRFDRPGEVWLGAWRGDRLVGAGGLSLDPYAATPATARIRHVYVLADARGMGIGAALVHAILDHARSRFDMVRLRTHNPAAARLYERLGLVPSDLPDETHRLIF